MAPGARSKFGAPIFETEVFRKQMYCIEESTCNIVGTFRRHHSDSAPGELSLSSQLSSNAIVRGEQLKSQSMNRSATIFAEKSTEKNIRFDV